MKGSGFGNLSWNMMPSIIEDRIIKGCSHREKFAGLKQKEDDSCSRIFLIFLVLRNQCTRGRLGRTQAV